MKNKLTRIALSCTMLLAAAVLLAGCRYYPQEKEKADAVSGAEEVAGGALELFEDKEKESTTQP